MTPPPNEALSDFARLLKFISSTTKLKILQLTVVTAILCTIPPSALTADAHGELYRYTFDLT